MANFDNLSKFTPLSIVYDNLFVQDGKQDGWLDAPKGILLKFFCRKPKEEIRFGGNLLLNDLELHPQLSKFLQCGE